MILVMGKQCFFLQLEVCLKTGVNVWFQLLCISTRLEGSDL